jgi:hypothetical protein
MRIRILVLSLIIAVAASAEPARKIPGITVKDVYPHGCVDCHTGKAGMPATIANLLASSNAAAKAKAFVGTFALKGKHPPITSVKEIPAGCTKCHVAAGKFAPPLPPMMHGVHLTGGDANAFLNTFGGECTHCHKFNSATGQWSMAK